MGRGIEWEKPGLLVCRVWAFSQRSFPRCGWRHHWAGISKQQRTGRHALETRDVPRKQVLQEALSPSELRPQRVGNHYRRGARSVEEERTPECKNCL